MSEPGTKRKRNLKIYNSSIYNRNLVTNRQLFNLYKNNDQIYYFRYNLLANSINHCELNYRQIPQLPSYSHPNLPCVPSVLHFLNLIGSSAGARAVQRQRIKGQNPGANWQPLPLVGRSLSPIYKYFTIVGKKIPIIGTKFNEIIDNIPPGYGIMVGTPSTYPSSHLFSIYKSESGYRLRVMLHLGRNRSVNKNLSMSNTGETLIKHLREEKYLPPNNNNGNLKLQLYTLVRRNNP